MNILKKEMLKIRNRASISIGHLLLKPRNDDQYIVAHPRSGSTWLRTILANILNPCAESNPVIFNALIPAVSIRNTKIVNRLSSPRIIMSHSSWISGIKRAVYVLRDGRDALISYYYYQTIRAGINMTFTDFVDLYEQEVYGACWGKHVTSWLEKGKSSMNDNLLVVRFEEMKKNTTNEVENVWNFLGIATDIETIKDAIKNADLKRVRIIEQSNSNKEITENESFYRSGKLKQWKGYMSENAMQRFIKTNNYALNLTKYL